MNALTDKINDFQQNSGEIAAASAGGTIIKDINAMQGFGNMDVLCMDKTGALTNESRCLSVQRRPVRLVWRWAYRPEICS